METSDFVIFHYPTSYPTSYAYNFINTPKPYTSFSISSFVSLNLPKKKKEKKISMDNHHDAWGRYAVERGCPSDEGMNGVASSSRNSPFLGTVDDMQLLESGLFRKQYGDYYVGGDGKSVDPRLLSLLEFFRELFVRRRELFRNIFPGLHDEFVEVSKKVGGVVAQVQENRRRAPTTVQRSLSVGSPRTPSGKRGEPPLRLERFKVRTVILAAGVGQGGKGGGGGGQQGSGASK